MNINKIMRDIVNATEGRYIGGVRDTSAPTDNQIHVLISIIGIYLKQHIYSLLILIKTFDLFLLKDVDCKILLRMKQRS